MSSGKLECGPRAFCLTIDADWVPGSHTGYERLLELTDRLKIPMTVFFTGRFAMEYPDLLRASIRRGDAVGTHGWEHGTNQMENFCTSTFGEQKTWIARTTEIIHNVSGHVPVIFRAPFLAPSNVTIAVLEELGYTLDSSIPARRCDCGFGQVNSPRYFFAPLTPYHPSRENIATHGTSPIWEVPPSAFGIPLNMRALRVLGLRPLKWATRQIVKRTPGLVFYGHPWEFGFTPPPHGAHADVEFNARRYADSNLEQLEEFVTWVRSLGCITAPISELVPS